MRSDLRSGVAIVQQGDCSFGGTGATGWKRRSGWMVIGLIKHKRNDDMPEAGIETKPPPVPMDIGQLIVDRAKPLIRAAGYAYEGPLAGISFMAQRFFVFNERSGSVAVLQRLQE